MTSMWASCWTSLLPWLGPPSYERPRLPDPRGSAGRLACCGGPAASASRLQGLLLPEGMGNGASVCAYRTTRPLRATPARTPVDLGHVHADHETAQRARGPLGHVPHRGPVTGVLG